MTFHSYTRPSYHFTPPTGWLNDPNGMVYHDGEYHLFYQYHPHDLLWGPMHWGHAVSKDLVTWEHLPVALYPDELGMIFSGSGVVDRHNTAGFGAGAMVLVFTHNHNWREIQSLAYSHDNGRTWAKYANNPVLEASIPVKDFRDPKVFWYDKGDGAGHWVMALAVGSYVLFYTSLDLKRWTQSGQFGPGYGSTEGVWETPELFPLQIEGTAEQQWVLLVAVGDGAIAGGSGVQYFIGDFDGHTFTTAATKEQVLWVDYGADFYAPQLWNDEPDGRRIGVAWCNNWKYARLTPADTFRGAFTVPREFGLVQTAQGVRLTQRPIAELQALRRMVQAWEDVKITSEPFTVSLPSSVIELIGEWEFPSGASTALLTLQLRWGESAQVVIIYDGAAQTLSVDRTRSGMMDFHPDFSAVHTAPLALRDNRLPLHLLVDSQMLELFADGGRVTITDQIFPPNAPLTLTISAEGGACTMTTFSGYDLAR
jgi:fructan beta-fructosidase